MRLANANQKTVDRARSWPDLRELPRDRWVPELKASQATGLCGFLDFEVLELVPGRARARLPLRDDLMMATGDFLHGATIVAFADTVAGWGSMASLPEGVTSATTSEMKVNVVATTQLPDALLCVAEMLHGGRSTQVWDVTVMRESDGRAVGYFRCTEHLLKPRT